MVEKIRSVRFNGTLTSQAWLSIVPSCEHVIRINERVYGGGREGFLFSDARLR